jgi:sirohydrochlorin ferrochelatase
MTDALILFSHGSVLCGSGEALDAHAGRLRRTKKFSMVEVGYMNYSTPAFPEAVAKCHAEGAKRIIIAPFFLVPGHFVTNSLPEHLATVKEDFPDLEFVVAEALGFDPLLADAVIESAQNPLGPNQWRDDLTAAARGCRANPECPLYGTPECPRVPNPERFIEESVE